MALACTLWSVNLPGHEPRILKAYSISMYPCLLSAMEILVWCSMACQFDCLIMTCSILAPVTPAGRVVFIVYSIMAVPIVTSFVLQTVTSCFTSMADNFTQRAKDKRAPEEAELKYFHSHACEPPMLVG